MAGSAAARRGKPAEAAGLDDAEAAGGDAAGDEAGAADAPAASGLRGRLARLGRVQKLLLGLGIVLILGVAGGAWPLLHLLRPGGAAQQEAGPPVFYNLPDQVVNLVSTDGKLPLLKISVSLELEHPEDKAVIAHYLPRIEDSFQSRLRALSRADLEGSERLYRLRAELLARIQLDIGPGHVRRVLFQDLIVR